MHVRSLSKHRGFGPVGGGEHGGSMVMALVASAVTLVAAASAGQLVESATLRAKAQSLQEAQEGLATFLAGAIDCEASLAPVYDGTNRCPEGAALPGGLVLFGGTRLGALGAKEFAAADNWRAHVECGASDLRIHLAPVRDGKIARHPVQGNLPLTAPVYQVSDGGAAKSVTVCKQFFGDPNHPYRLYTMTNAHLQEAFKSYDLGGHLQSSATTCDGRLGLLHSWFDWGTPNADPSCHDPAAPDGWATSCRRYRKVWIEGIWPMDPATEMPAVPMTFSGPDPLGSGRVFAAKTPESTALAFYGRVNNFSHCSHMCATQGYVASRFVSCNPDATFKPTGMVADRADSELTCLCIR